MTVQATLVIDDRYVGLEGLVTEVDELNRIRVYISGSYWPAKAEQNQHLDVLSRIRVKARHGITLIVEPA